MLKKLVLICGCGHTGSSILARIIGSHPSVYLVNPVSNMFMQHRRDYEDDHLKELISNADSESKSLILEKTARHVYHIDYIRKKYPNSKFILTTRDGRETIASLYDRTKNLQSSMDRYTNDSYMSLRQIGQKDVMLTRYEDLIDDTVKHLDNLCNWIGIDFSPEMLLYHHKPISWNMNNPYSLGKMGEHEHLRNRQVNLSLYKQTRNWKDRIPNKFVSQVNEFFLKGNLGYRIMCDFGYKDYECLRS